MVIVSNPLTLIIYKDSIGAFAFFLDASTAFKGGILGWWVSLTNFTSKGCIRHPIYHELVI
jgi:hypothetical protein